MKTHQITTPLAREFTLNYIEMRRFGAKSENEEKCQKASNIKVCRLMKGYIQDDKNTIRVSRQYTIKTRKLLIFKDFLGLLRAIYYPFTTFENQKN